MLENMNLWKSPFEQDKLKIQWRFDDGLCKISKLCAISTQNPSKIIKMNLKYLTYAFKP